MHFPRGAYVVPLEAFFDCPARAIPEPQAMTATTPARPNIPGVRLDMSACEGDSSTSKRTRCGDTPDPMRKRHCSEGESPADINMSIVRFAQFTLRAISELFINLPNDGSTTVFGERREELPGRKYVQHPGFQTDPWGRGVVPPPPAMIYLNLSFSFLHRHPCKNYGGISWFMRCRGLHASLEWQ